jgi:hypothetical protein
MSEQRPLLANVAPELQMDLEQHTPTPPDHPSLACISPSQGNIQPQHTQHHQAFHQHQYTNDMPHPVDVPHFHLHPLHNHDNSSMTPESSTKITDGISMGNDTLDNTFNDALDEEAVLSLVVAEQPPDSYYSSTSVDPCTGGPMA